MSNNSSEARLTSRELQVLQLLFEGKSNKEIASELFISQKTVEFHLSNLYIKIKAHSRTEAVVWAIKHGITPKNQGFS
jgi:NarL family two-component system response regulator LiaR